mmetsp:Transcript_16163/g.32444  ORF Transcript_16163/g.32444 Transcript_16163/m.32444 type:complete len:162 (-) Transcript_16163:156-641(-)
MLLLATTAAAVPTDEPSSRSTCGPEPSPPLIWTLTPTPALAHADQEKLLGKVDSDFWHDQSHPSAALHRVLAQVLGKQIEASRPSTDEAAAGSEAAVRMEAAARKEVNADADINEIHAELEADATKADVGSSKATEGTIHIEEEAQVSALRYRTPTARSVM